MLTILYSVLYNTHMAGVNRKLIAVRIDPEAWKRARIAAIQDETTVGKWLEAAIDEKITRETEALDVPEKRR